MWVEGWGDGVSEGEKGNGEGDDGNACDDDIEGDGAEKDECISARSSEVEGMEEID